MKADKDLRREATELFFVFRRISQLVAGGEVRKSLAQFGLILGQAPSLWFENRSSRALFLTRGILHNPGVRGIFTSVLLTT